MIWYYENGVVGMSMSISLPAKNGGFQKTLNFYSGKTTKKGNIAAETMKSLDTSIKKLVTNMRSQISNYTDHTVNLYN